MTSRSRRRFLRKLRLLFIPSEENTYRPKILRKTALTIILASVLIIEGAMFAQLVANTSLRDLLAAIFPASIVAFTNDERASQALGALKESELLRTAAQAKAEDMALKGYFSHVRPDGREPWAWLKEAGYDYGYAGENLAVHFYDSKDVVNAWMASPTHKANIVKPVYTEIGIGVATGVYEGRVTTFVVQFFGTPKAKVAGAVKIAEAAELPQKVNEPAAASTTREERSTPLPAGEEGIPLIGGEEAPAPQADIPFLSRIAGSPRTAAAYMLSAILGLIVLSLALTFFVKIQIQPLNLLANGALAAAFVVGLLAFNAYFLGSGIKVTDEAAASVFQAAATSSIGG